MRIALRYLALALCVVGISTSAVADQIQGSLTGLTNPDNLITFDQVSPLVENMLVTNQYAGATFSGFAWDDGTSGQSGATGFSGGDLANGYYSWPYDSTMTITFSGVVNAAVFAAVDLGNQYTFRAYLNGGVVDTMLSVTVGPNPGPGNSGPGYFGFANENFDKITITRDNPANLTPFSIDNLQYYSGAIHTGGDETGGGTGSDPVVVPEPASLFLFGSALSAFGLLLRRKNKLS